MRKSSSDRQLLLVPHGGLANRMYAMASVHAFAQQYAFDLRILWFRDSLLNARFEDVFQPVDGVELRNNNFLDHFLFEHDKRSNLSLPSRIKPLLFDRILERVPSIHYAVGQGNSLYSLFSDSRNGYINSCYSLYEPNNAPRLFFPSKKVEQTMQPFMERFTQKTIGVHIRRTDLAIAIRQSPTTLFIAEMEKAIEQEPEIRFFLASDDQEVKQTIVQHFGLNRVIVHLAPTSRDTTEGIIQGASDLFLLARTHAIWGSSGSTFSTMAALLGNSPHRIITL